MSERRIPTLIDVARRAGVSTATVSRCLNTPDAVRGETRERVQSAVDALGYTPHFGARALASNRTNSVGAIIPTMENAIFARGLQAMEEELAQTGATLLVASSGYDPQKEAAQIQALVRRGVDGVLLIGHARPAESYEPLLRHETPYVLAWSATKDLEANCVGFDNVDAAQKIARQVLAMGHQDIAMIAGVTRWNDRAADRVAGVTQALNGHGLSLPAKRLIEAPYTIAAGQAAFHRLVERGGVPTAVICGNDVLAAGALKAARERSFKVPEDLSITGFDNIDLSEAVDPPLSTMHVPHRRMGRIAAQVLLKMRDGGAPPKQKLFQTSFIPRASLGPVRKG